MPEQGLLAIKKVIRDCQRNVVPFDGPVVYIHLNVEKGEIFVVKKRKGGEEDGQYEMKKFRVQALKRNSEKRWL